MRSGDLPSPLRPWGDLDWVRPSAVVGWAGVGLVVLMVVASALSIAGVWPNEQPWSTDQLVRTALTAAAALAVASVPLPFEKPNQPYSGAAGGVAVGVAAAAEATLGWVALVGLLAPTMKPVQMPRTPAWNLAVRGVDAVSLVAGWAVARVLIGTRSDLWPSLARSAVVLVAAVGLAVVLRAAGSLLQPDGERPPVLSHEATRRILPGYLGWLVATVAATDAALSDDTAGVVIGVAALALGAGWLAHLARRVALRELELETLAEKEARVGENLRLLYRHVVEQQQQERSELAGALHDEVLQSLSAAWGMLTDTGGAVDGSIEHVLHSTRGLIDELHSPVVDALGLEAALRQMVKRQAGGTGEVRLYVDPVLAGVRGEMPQRTLRACRDLVRAGLELGERLEVMVRCAESGEEADEARQREGETHPVAALVEVLVEGLVGLPDPQLLESLAGRVPAALSVEADEDGVRLTGRVWQVLRPEPPVGG